MGTAFLIAALLFKDPLQDDLGKQPKLHLVNLGSFKTRMSVIPQQKCLVL